MMKPVRKIHTYNFFWYLLGVVLLAEACYLGWCMGNWAWNKAIDAGLVTHTIYVPYRVEIEKGDTLYSIACRVATSDDHLTNLAWQIQQSAGIDDCTTLKPGQIITFTLPRKEVVHHD